MCFEVLQLPQPRLLNVGVYVWTLMFGPGVRGLSMRQFRVSTWTNPPGLRLLSSNMDTTAGV